MDSTVMNMRTPAIRRSRTIVEGNFEATRRWYQIIRLIYTETPQTECSVFQRLLNSQPTGIFSGEVLRESVIKALQNVYPEREIRRENAMAVIQRLMADEIVGPVSGNKSKFIDDSSFTKIGVQTYLPNTSESIQRASSLERTSRAPEALSTIKKRLNRFVSPTAKFDVYASSVEDEENKTIHQEDVDEEPQKLKTPFTRLRNSFNRKKPRNLNASICAVKSPVVNRTPPMKRPLHLVDIKHNSSTPVLVKFQLFK
ncbi:hypothetical protein M3Y98_00561900 [Aphelenchoides besseyi]|nr:hypothetical protein M3Y98_00561900 [Aphelenchoides besseyi]